MMLGTDEYFIGDEKSSFYESAIFTKILNYVQANTQSCKMKERETRQGLRLLLIFENISSIRQALNALQGVLA